MHATVSQNALENFPKFLLSDKKIIRKVSSRIFVYFLIQKWLLQYVCINKLRLESLNHAGVATYFYPFGVATFFTKINVYFCFRNVIFSLFFNEANKVWKVIIHIGRSSIWFAILQPSILTTFIRIVWRGMSGTRLGYCSLLLSTRSVHVTLSLVWS